uniref:Uncharacterized protein n=1 Tax=Sipha flava TaxID=143950 RepID=A0A2S2QL91_9HEMI
MNLRKQQMHLQLQQQHQQQQQQQPHRRQDNRTGFEVLLDQPAAARATAETSSSAGVSAGTAWSPNVGAAWSPGGGTAWSPSADTTAGRYRNHHVHYHQHDRPNGSAAEPENGWPGKPTDAATPNDIGFVDGDGGISPTATAAATSPPPPSPLSLPSPYYDRNPIVGFPLHNHHHQHHHSSKSPVTAAAAAAAPLANVQNVVHAGADQDHHDHYANNSKYYYQRQNHKSGGLMDERDDDKENIKQRDAESLQQQLDEVLRACVDYEERNKNRQLQPATMSLESSGSASPGSATTTTPPQQNRIKTNGSLPRDTCKKTSNGTSSPTATLSPTSPLSQLSVAPLSPSSMTWTSTSPPTLSPLSIHANGTDIDSVFLENDHYMVKQQSTQKVATCGSPRTRIRTLVQPSPATVTTNITADSFYGR